MRNWTWCHAPIFVPSTCKICSFTRGICCYWVIFYCYSRSCGAAPQVPPLINWDILWQWETGHDVVLWWGHRPYVKYDPLPGASNGSLGLVNGVLKKNILIYPLHSMPACFWLFESHLNPFFYVAYIFWIHVILSPNASVAEWYEQSATQPIVAEIYKQQSTYL